MERVQSVDRALLLLSEIGREPGGLVELATRVGLPTSTVARLLGTLEDAEAIVRPDDRTYEIGPLVQSMIVPESDTSSLEATVHPHLVEISGLLDEAACLAMVSGDDTVTVNQVDAPKPVQAENWTGTRVPMHAGGAGIVVMATWTDAEVDNYLAGELASFSSATVTDVHQLKSRVRHARMRRVMWTHGEYVDGLSSCSAAIADHRGRAVAVLYVYGPTYRFPADGEADRIARVVLERAVEISRGLGWRPNLSEAS